MGNNRTALRRAVEAAHCVYDLYGDLPHEIWAVIAAYAAHIAKVSSWPIDQIVEASARVYERCPRPLEPEDDAFVQQLLSTDPEAIETETEDGSEDDSDSVFEPDPFA